MSDFKTNYFGSFLDAVRAPTPGPVGAPVGAAAAAAQAPTPGPADNMLKYLSDSDAGQAAIRDMLPVAGHSVDALLAAVGNLQMLGLAVSDGSQLRITDAGRAQVGKLHKP